MGHCVHFPALYDTPNTGCLPVASYLATPAAPVPTWGEITVEWPDGCNLAATVCWELEFDRDPSALCDLSAVYGESVPGDGPFGLAAGFSSGYPHTADWGPTHYWQGKGVTRYELLVAGVVVATVNGSQSFPGGSAEGPLWTPPPTCVTLPAGLLDWSSPRDLSVRAYFNDVPESVQFCFYFGDLDCSDQSGIGATCSQDTLHDQCWEDFVEPLRARRQDYTAGAPANQPTACGTFAGVACTVCACCSTPHVGDPTDLCGVPVVHTDDRWDYPAIDYTFTSPEATFRCPIPFREEFEDCASAPEDRFGSTSCADTGFYCSPTHVLEIDLGAPAYWQHEALSGRGPAYVSAVLWLPPVWTLPPSYSNDIFALGILGDLGDASPYFEGIALRVTTDGAGSPTVFALGVWGEIGVSFTTFGTPTELTVGVPNCLQFKYWAGDGTLSPSPSLHPIGTVVANGVEVGREARARTGPPAYYPPVAEAVVWGAVEYASDPTDLLSDVYWLDDVSYGQANWINCSCLPAGPFGPAVPALGGDVYLTRAVAPEEADPAWSPPSAGDIVNLRGVTSDSSGNL